MPKKPKPYSKGDLVRAIQQVAREAAPDKENESYFLELLQTFFKGDPRRLPALEERFPTWEHPTIHIALQKCLERATGEVKLYGVGMQNHHGSVTMGELLKTRWAPEPISVQYRNIMIEETAIACVQNGLFLCRIDGRPFGILLHGPINNYDEHVDVSVIGPEKALCEAFFAELRRTMRGISVYRGKVLQLSCSRGGGLSVHTPRLPAVEREQIILPSGLIDRIERQTIQFSRHAEKLKTVGQHLKRGILLFGPPGTGKTFSAMYLASRMKGRTVILLTGNGLGLISQACAFARALQPSTIILEDADLVAKDRTDQETGTNAVLFELLNQMDGLAEDADILFLLTTNRPDVLEPALASRPGRIDLAIEVPLPDAECRRRLLTLYARGFRFEVGDLDVFVQRTEGVSAAFIRELIRKAALNAADEGEEVIVLDKHLDHALHELLIQGGGLTRSLLGAVAQA